MGRRSLRLETTRSRRGLQSYSERNARRLDCLISRYPSWNDRGYAADVRSTRGKRFQIRHCVGIDSHGASRASEGAPENSRSPRYTAAKIDNFIAIAQRLISPE